MRNTRLGRSCVVTSSRDPCVAEYHRYAPKGFAESNGSDAAL